jgi:hypothetical protein
MKACFVAPVLPAAVTRPIIRLRTPRTKPQVHDGVDDYMRTEVRVDAYFNQNLEFLDRGYDFDEFQDIDDEHEGLTITEPMSEAEMFQFCTGYDII